jgi:L-ribulokinase
MGENYCIGIDYGTDSVRSVIVDAEDGSEVSSSVYYYKRWKEGKYSDPARNQFRQHPQDYLDGLEFTIKDALANAPEGAASKIKGISVDTTGSTPVAVNKEGVPLALMSGFQDNPNAMFILWKDHTAVKEASEITELARNWGGEDYTRYSGGIYSSEWFWAKLLHILRTDKEVREAAFSWVEHCDWIPAVLVGETNPLELKRSRCAAGHKAMWHESFNGLPSEEFLVKLDPLLSGLRARLYSQTYTSDQKAGHLSETWAQKLGLSTDVAVGVGAFDAHMGAVGAGIEPYSLTKVMGTSTCDMLTAPTNEMGSKLIKGICGQVDGSITPGMLGMEAGQSAFGDIYAWFEQVLLWPVKNIISKSTLVDEATREKLITEASSRLIPELTLEAEKIPVEESTIVALDWMNGRRTPDADQLLKGAITGLTLGSDAPRIFRALVEATAFGAKKIVDRFIQEGVKIENVIALGGVAKKSPFVMQTVADILNMPIKVVRSEQTCALGAAMFASVCSGLYGSVEKAQKAIGSGFEVEYRPDAQRAKKYRELYEKYTRLGNFIEKESRQ